MKIAVGMSGGIDSSVAAKMLKDAGHDVFGVTMLVWKSYENKKTLPTGNSCFSPDKSRDIETTKEICRKLDIPHLIIDLSDSFTATVLENFRSEYLSGRTPNPCVWCNQKIKFGALLNELKRKADFDKFATGHYAKILKDEATGRYCISRAKDPVKDQSYFLYRLSQEQLENTLFPLGDYCKTEVRQIDFSSGFHEEGQTESQDFYDGDYGDLLGTANREGCIVDKSGKVLGRHNGIWHYTIGQRRGLGISSPRPLYVTNLNIERNEVVVGFEEDVFSTTVTAGNIVWGKLPAIENPIEAFAKIRSVGEPMPVLVSYKENKLIAEFVKPVKAATPGQSLVIYDSDGSVLAGGIINSPQ